MPEFFAYITEMDDDSDYDREARLNTAMSHVYDRIISDKGRSKRSKVINYTDLFELDYETGDPNGTYTKRRDSVIEFIKKAEAEIKRLNFVSKIKNRAEKLLAKEAADALFYECIERVEKVADDNLYYRLLKKLDSEEAEDENLSSVGALLFAAMCYANDAYLIKKLKKTDYEMLDLVFAEGEDIPQDGADNLIYLFGKKHIIKRKF